MGVSKKCARPEESTLSVLRSPSSRSFESLCLVVQRFFGKGSVGDSYIKEPKINCLERAKLLLQDKPHDLIVARLKAAASILVGECLGETLNKIFSL